MTFARTLDDPAVVDLLARHRSFWQRGEATSPLMPADTGASMEAGLSAEQYHLTPARLRAEEIGGVLEAGFARHGVISGDAFRLAKWTHGSGFQWIGEAMLGSPIHTSRGDHIYWAEPLPGGLDQALTITRATGGDWRAAILGLVERVAGRCGGRYPLPSAIIRGPVDILSALLGHQGMCEALLLRPQDVLRVLDVCTDLTIDLAQRFNALLPQFHGGSFNSERIWAPGTTATYNVDAACLVSAAMYRQFFLPFDRRICAAFAYPVVHTHSVSQRHWPALLEIENLTIQTAVDPMGPSLEDMLPAVRQVQQQRSFCMHLLEQQVEPARAALDPRGLLLAPYVSER